MTATITVDRLDLERLLDAAGVRSATIWRVLAGHAFALADAAGEAEQALADAEDEGRRQALYEIEDDAELDAEFQAAASAANPATATNAATIPENK